MALSTIGGSTGTINQGKTPNSIQKSATAENGMQVIKQAVLAPNYAQKPALLSTGISLADWYRNGATGTTTRISKQVEPIEDDTAAFQVFGSLPKGTKKPTDLGKNDLDGDVELVPKFTKFILESMSEAHSERSQVSETFGSFYAFFFGERPPVYSYSGMLINAKDINWRADFQFYYDNYLRGSKCVERNARLVMTYGGRQIEGFMLNFQTNTDAASEVGVKVSFQILITDRLAVLGLSQDFNVFDNNGLQLSDDSFTKMLNDIAGKEGKGLSSQATSIAYNEAKKVADGGAANGTVNLTGESNLSAAFTG